MATIIQNNEPKKVTVALPAADTSTPQVPGADWVHDEPATALTTDGDQHLPDDAPAGDVAVDDPFTTEHSVTAVPAFDPLAQAAEPEAASTAQPAPAADLKTAIPGAATLPATQAPKDRPQQLLGQSISGAMDVFEVDPATFEAPEDLESIPTGPEESTNTQVLHEWTTKNTDAQGAIDNPPVPGESVLFYSERSENADARVRAYADRSVFTTPEGKQWNEILRNSAINSSYFNNQFDGAVKRPMASWRQLVPVESGTLAMARPRFAEKGIPSATGDRAMLRIKSLLGVGGTIQVPLWHSGFWVQLKAPSDGALIELQRRMTEDKITYGRDTLGLVFSNEQSFQVSWLFEFCMLHMVESSAVFEGNVDLMRKHIKAPDLNLMLWGIAALAWPRGFTYYRSLTTTDGIKEKKTVAGALDIMKLLWTDINMLTAEQKQHMSRRSQGCHKLESILEYQERFELATGREVVINDSVSLVLGVPSLDAQINQGIDWVQKIVTMIDATFTVAQPDDDDRNTLVNLHTRAALLRRYSPWIKHVNADGVIHDQFDEIVGTLEAIASMDTNSVIRLRVEGMVKKFIDDTCVSLVAIPETSGRDTGIPRFQSLIPINVIQTFFILLAQRIQRIALV